MFDIKKVREEAEAEIRAEKTLKAKEKLKAKLKERDNAKMIYDNLTREIEDLVAELGQQFS